MHKAFAYPDRDSNHIITPKSQRLLIDRYTGKLTNRVESYLNRGETDLLEMAGGDTRSINAFTTQVATIIQNLRDLSRVDLEAVQAILGNAIEETRAIPAVLQGLWRIDYLHGEMKGTRTKTRLTEALQQTEARVRSLFRGELLMHIFPTLSYEIVRQVHPDIGPEKPSQLSDAAVNLISRPKKITKTKYVEQEDVRLSSLPTVWDSTEGLSEESRDILQLVTPIVQTLDVHSVEPKTTSVLPESPTWPPPLIQNANLECVDGKRVRDAVAQDPYHYGWEQVLERAKRAVTDHTDTQLVARRIALELPQFHCDRHLEELIRELYSWSFKSKISYERVQPNEEAVHSLYRELQPKPYILQQDDARQADKHTAIAAPLSIVDIDIILDDARVAIERNATNVSSKNIKQIVTPNGPRYETQRLHSLIYKLLLQHPDAETLADVFPNEQDPMHELFMDSDYKSFHSKKAQRIFETLRNSIHTLHISA